MSQDNVDVISQTELLCRTCRFTSKCPVVHMINKVMEETETEAFRLMKVDLDLVPVVTYCPEYQKHPQLIRQQNADSDELGEDLDEEE